MTADQYSVFTGRYGYRTGAGRQKLPPENEDWQERSDDVACVRMF
jgi:hypothetical protein